MKFTEINKINPRLQSWASKSAKLNRFFGFIQETDKSVRRTRALDQAHD